MGPVETAEILAAARREGRRLPSLPAPEPLDLAAAYALQDDYTRAMGTARVGWKVGATSQLSQQALGVVEPFAGPLFENNCFAGPVSLKTPEDCMCIIEAEFAFRVGRDLPPRAEAYSREEVLRALDSLHPAIEVVDTRCLQGFDVGVRWLIADGGANLFFVHGPGTTDWRDWDLPAHPVTVEVDGAPKASGRGANAYGDPASVAVWLANHLRERQPGLQAGDWISTGLTTEIFSALPGDVIEADFGPLGRIELEIEAG